MKKIIFILMVGSLFMGCAKQMQTQWKLDMPVDEFKTQNDNLLLIEKSADTTIYFRRESAFFWDGDYNISNKYIFVNEKLHLVKFWYPIPDKRVKPLKGIQPEKGMKSIVSGSFHFIPKCGIGFHPKGSKNIIGTSFGYGNYSWGNAMLDLTIFGSGDRNPSGVAFVLVYEKKFRDVSFQSGLGLMSTSYKDASEWDGYRDQGNIAFRFGIGYDIPIKKFIIY